MIYELYSFDFDGALANYEYLGAKDKDIIRANIELLEQIKASTNPGSYPTFSSSSKKPRLIVFVGSNRQSFKDDFVNASPNERGSCYPAIKRISKWLGAELDDMLLGDIYNNLPDGTCFKRALKLIDKKNGKGYSITKLPEDTDFPDWLHDDSKLSVLYAQIHKMSLEHPGDTLNYNFVDDREDILNNLHDYFTKYPEMLPHNVTLKLKRYIGPINVNGQKVDPLVTEYTPIQGTRPFADENYRHTIKTIAAVTIEEMTAQQYDLLTVKSSRPVKTYAEAQHYRFDMTAIKCVHYYKPGMLPANPPEVAPSQKEFKLFGRVFRSSSSLSLSHHSGSHSPRPSPLSCSAQSSAAPPRHRSIYSQSASSLSSPIPISTTSSTTPKFQSDPGPYFCPPTSSTDSFNNINTRETIESNSSSFDLNEELFRISDTPETNSATQPEPTAATQPFEFASTIGGHRFLFAATATKPEDEETIHDEHSSSMESSFN